MSEPLYLATLPSGEGVHLPASEIERLQAAGHALSVVWQPLTRADLEPREPAPQPAADETVEETDLVHDAGEPGPAGTEVLGDQDRWHLPQPEPH